MKISSIGSCLLSEIKIMHSLHAWPESHLEQFNLLSYTLDCVSMCADEDSSTKDTPILIFLSAIIIFLFLVIAIVLVTIMFLVRWKKGEVQLDQEHLYDTPHFPLDSSNSATKYDDVKLNVAYSKVNISGTGYAIQKSNIA